MPIEIIHGFSILKKAAALTNQRFGLNSSKGTIDVIQPRLL